MMKKRILFLSFFLLGFSVVFAGGGKKTQADNDINLTVWANADANTKLGVEAFNEAVDEVNALYQSQGKETNVSMEIEYSKSKGYDEDILKVMRAIAVNKGPDIFLAPHEWLAALSDAGHILDIDNYVDASSQFDDYVQTLWNTVRYKNKRWAFPVIPEVRMFFYNKDMLRAIGRSDEFINGIPAAVQNGTFTIGDFTDLAEEVVSTGNAQYGIIHRPNTGPDWYMAIAGFGQSSFQDASGKMIYEKDTMLKALRWVEDAVNRKVLFTGNSSMSWDAIHASFIQGETFIKFHGIWGVPAMKDSGSFGDGGEDSYFEKVGWSDFPPAQTGGRSANLTHPLAWAVSSDTPSPEAAFDLIAAAIKPERYTTWAEERGYLAIYESQKEFPSYQNAWTSVRGSNLLNNAISIPLHPDGGTFTEILFKAFQGVETGRITPEEGVEFVEQEVRAELGDKVVIR